ncbi:MAG: hypothetical protein R3E79_00485 [Caldilineaceae bacterium]
MLGIGQCGPTDATDGAQARNAAAHHQRAAAAANGRSGDTSPGGKVGAYIFDT